MSARFFIENGETISPVMSFDWDGALVAFMFYDGAGDPVAVTGIPLVFHSLYETGNVWKTVYPFAVGEWRFNGPASRVMVDLSGVSGYTTYRILVWRTNEPMPLVPDGAYTGLRAETVQFYSEANIKNGLQFFLRASWPLTDEIAISGTRKIWFKTNSKPVIIKKREFQYIAEEMRISLYSGPTTVTGGTALAINNYNGVSPTATTVQALKGVTTVSDGTLLADPEYFYGAKTTPQQTVAMALTGRERILPANTEFIIAVSNTGTTTSRAEYHLDWYEGGTDLPIQPQ